VEATQRDARFLVRNDGEQFAQVGVGKLDDFVLANGGQIKPNHLNAKVSKSIEFFRFKHVAPTAHNPPQIVPTCNLRILI